MRLIIRNQNGFVLALMVALLPLFVSLCMGLFFLKAWLSPQEQVLHLCRSGLLHTFEKTGAELQNLFQMNRQVLTLRSSRQKIEAELETAMVSGNPGLIALAEAQLSSVILEQQLLMAQQKEKLWTLHQEMQIGKRQTESGIEAAFLKTHNAYEKHFAYAGFLLPTSEVALAIHALPSPDTGPPIYEPDPDFSEKQRAHVHWKSSMRSSEKGRELWFSGSYQKQGGCAVSLQIQGQKIIPVISEAKSSLSFF
jgi:hypothetical protein